MHDLDHAALADVRLEQVPNHMRLLLPVGKWRQTPLISSAMLAGRLIRPVESDADADADAEILGDELLCRRRTTYRMPIDGQ